MLLCYCSTRSSENSKSDRTENEEKKRDALLLANHCMLCRIIRTCTVLHNTSNRIEHRSDRVVVDSIKRFDVFCSSSFILRLIGAFSFLSWSFFSIVFVPFFFSRFPFYFISVCWTHESMVYFFHCIVSFHFPFDVSLTCIFSLFLFSFSIFFL